MCKMTARQIMSMTFILYNLIRWNYRIEVRNLKKVLITGMNGLIGNILRRHLERTNQYELSGLSRSNMDGIEWHQADVKDLAAIISAFEKKDVVVHLSAQLAKASWEEMAETNLLGAYNVFEAARLTGVKRVVFASSGATIRGFDYSYPYDLLASGKLDEMPDDWDNITVDQIRPMDVYGATKAWGEIIGRVFSDMHGISVICVRIGSVPSSNRPESDRERSVFFSHHDVATLLEASIDAPESIKYEVVYGSSNNKWGCRDLEHTYQVLGWKPRDSAES